MGEVIRNGKFKEWIAVIVAGGSLIFSAGQWYQGSGTKIDAMQKEIDTMKQELARKDVVQGQLQLLDLRIATMAEAMNRTEKKMDDVLKYIK